MQGFREKLEQLGIDIKGALETANPMLTDILEQVLCYYWEFLCNNPEFVSDYNRLMTESSEIVQEFAQKWKLPEPYKRALIVACLKGLPNNPMDIKPHLVRVSVNLQEELKLPEWFPCIESDKSYTKRVNKLVNDYISAVKQVYKREGLYISPSQYAKWRDSEYQKKIAQMLYARVIEGKRDTEYIMHNVPSTILKECSFWLKRLGFPPETLRRKRGRPPKAKNRENQR